MGLCPEFLVGEVVPIGYRHMLKLRREKENLNERIGKIVREVTFPVLTVFTIGAERQNDAKEEEHKQQEVTLCAINKPHQRACVYRTYNTRSSFSVYQFKCFHVSRVVRNEGSRWTHTHTLQK